MIQQNYSALTRLALEIAALHQDSVRGGMGKQSLSQAALRQVNRVWSQHEVNEKRGQVQEEESRWQADRS